MSYPRNALVWAGGRVQCVSDELPPPGPTECWLELTSLGLCSSDFHIWNGRKNGGRGILGHEGSGRVLAVGSEVRDWRPGDRAVVNPLLNCGECDDCRAGAGQVCSRRQIIGYNGGGLLASAQTLQARSLFRPPASLPEAHGCLVEPLSCVIHGQRLPARRRPESSMLIFGCGPMGVLHAAYAKHRGVERVAITDPNPAKLELARSRGVPADAWIPFDDVRSAEAAEVTVTATSARSGHVAAFDRTASGGQVLAFASILDEPGPIALPDGPFDSDDVHRREDVVRVRAALGEVDVVGAIGFDADSFAEAAELLAGPLDGERFITGSVRLEDVPDLVAGEWERHLKIRVDPGVR